MCLRLRKRWRWFLTVDPRWCHPTNGLIFGLQVLVRYSSKVTAKYSRASCEEREDSSGVSGFEKLYYFQWGYQKKYLIIYFLRNHQSVVKLFFLGMPYRFTSGIALHSKSPEFDGRNSLKYFQQRRRISSSEKSLVLT